MLSRGQIISIFHILFVVPLLFYIGKKGNNLTLNEKRLISVLGVFIILYHSYKTYLRGASRGWINIFHVLVVGGLLLGVWLFGYKWIYSIILMLGFAALGYHIMLIYNRLSKK
jgi:hypothetical protein